MKFVPLIWSGIWRKPGRTILIFLQVCIAFALFGVLQGLKTGIEHAVNDARADLLLVHGRLSLIDPLPLGLLSNIASLPGVKVAVPVELAGAVYQNPTQKLILVAIRPEGAWLDAFTFTVKPEHSAALRKNRTGALVIESMMKKYRWKIGDRIPLIGTTKQMNGSSNWEFEIVGTFTDADLGSGGDAVLINFDFFDEARAFSKGTVSHFNVAVTDPKLALAVSDEIDHRFANSSHETKTESLRELAQSQMQEIGDLDFLIRSIVGAVLAALLFATASMMMQSTRERTPELAVLKTLGFTDRSIFIFILTESVAVCVAAAACGLALATLAFPFASKFVPGLSMPLIVVLIGLGIGALVALVSATIPAALAARLNIITALAQR
jgi:putative ABC transport system permease protein